MTKDSASRSSSAPNQLAGIKPPDVADRNPQALSEAIHHPPKDVLLPSLEHGISLLDIEEGRDVSIVQSLVLDHLLMHDGPAFWIDARGYASTTSLARLAPSQHMLDRIHIARGFTAFQHYSLIADLGPVIDDRASLVIVPAVDTMYRGDDLTRGEPDDLLAGVLERLTPIARTYGIPVLVTREARDVFTSPVEKVADECITCEQTRFGPRFTANGVETQVYPLGNGLVQTTLAYWRQVLLARIKAREQQPVGIAYGAD